MWKTWLPDIFLNPHGYPKHEWVQYFAGYVAWVRARFPKAHDWYGPRGWFMPNFKYVEDPKYPHHKEVAYALRDYIAKGINSLPEVQALNKRAYSRYDRYGGRFDPSTSSAMITKVFASTNR